MGNSVSNFYVKVQEVVEAATNFAVAVDNLVIDIAKYLPVEYSLVRVHSKSTLKPVLNSLDLKSKTCDDSKMVQLKHTNIHTHTLLSDGDKGAYYAKLVQAAQDKFHTLWFEKYHYRYDVNPQITRNGTTYMGTGNDVTVYLNPVSAAIAGVPTPALLVQQIIGQADNWAPNCELKEFTTANTNYFTNLLSSPTGVNFGGTSATAPWKDATGEPTRTAHIDWAVLTASTDYQIPGQPTTTLSIACAAVVQWPWVA